MKNRSYCLIAAVGFLLLASPRARSASEISTQDLVAVLQSEAALPEKAQACQRLGEYGSAEAVPALATLLNHPILSTYARAGLERIPHPSASAALRAAVSTAQGDPLVGVINSLGMLRDPEAVELLSRLATASEPAVARAALMALGRIADDASLALMREPLTSETPELRSTAAAACLIAAEQQLAQGKSETAASLYEAVRLAEVAAPYRIGATRGAILARQPNHIPMLLEQLRSEDRALRDVALLIIREIPSDELAAALNRAIGQTSTPTKLRVQLITALKDCHNAESINRVRSTLDDANPEVRLTALAVLSAIGGPDTAPALLDVLEQPRSSREVAIVMERLSQMPGTEVDQLILKALSTSAASDARVNLMRLLEQRLVTDAIDALLRQAADAEPQVAIAAFRALKPIAAAESVSRLVTLTQALENDRVRNSAEQALYWACINAEEPDQAAEVVLGELQHATDPTAKMSWTRVLASLGYARALPTITRGLHDGNHDLVTFTIVQLGDWPDPTPIDDLFQVLENSPNAADRKRALSSVIRLATAAAVEEQRSKDVLVEWFERADPAVETVAEKRLLVSGLSRVPHVDSIRLLDPYLDDSTVRAEAITALIEVLELWENSAPSDVIQSALNRLSDVQDPGLRRRITALKR